MSSLTIVESICEIYGVPIGVFNLNENYSSQISSSRTYNNIMDDILRNIPDLINRTKIIPVNELLSLIINNQYNFIIYRLIESDGNDAVVIGPWIESESRSQLENSRLVATIDNSSYFKSLIFRFANDNLEQKIVPLVINSEASVDSKIFNEYISHTCLDRNYHFENELLESVSRGDYHAALRNHTLLRSTYRHQPYRRDDERSYKHYASSFNTMCRKAAERGEVPSNQIHILSEKFVSIIENSSSPEELANLSERIIFEYCDAVVEASIRGLSEIVQAIKKYIDSHFSDDINVSSISKTINANRAYISKKFKEETGSTIIAYLNKKRINHACYLLRNTSHQITTISLLCGYDDPNYFSRIFKSHIGNTPKMYRELIKS